MTSSFSRVVVFAPNWLGDAVMALPALADVRRHFVDAHLAVAARSGLAPVFESVPGVDEVVPLAPDDKPSKRSRADKTRLNAGRFDLAILFPNSFYSAWIARRAGIAARWGYRGDFRRMLLTRAVRRPRGPVHQAAYYQQLLSKLGAPNGPLVPQIIVPERSRQAALELLAREGWASHSTLVGLAPGAAYGFAKQWPAERFAAVTRLLAGHGVWCLLVGRSEDRAAGQDLLAALERGPSHPRGSTRVLNLIGRTDIRQLMGLMTYCGTVVANDSGAAHLAAAIGVPVVAIFGPTDERISTPLPGRASPRPPAVLTHDVFCRPCMLRECPIDHRCMRRIETTRVFEAVMEQLAPPVAAVSSVGFPRRP